MNSAHLHPITDIPPLLHTYTQLMDGWGPLDARSRLLKTIEECLGSVKGRVGDGTGSWAGGGGS
jgi:hypothetical protein